jgi:hypothetical protein
MFLKEPTLKVNNNIDNMDLFWYLHLFLFKKYLSNLKKLALFEVRLGYVYLVAFKLG